MCSLCDAIDQHTFQEIRKQLPEIELAIKFEKNLAAKMLAAYNKSAYTAISKASSLIKKGKGPIKDNEIQKIISLTDGIMNTPFTSDQETSFDKSISRFYIAQRKMDTETWQLPIPAGIEEVAVKDLMKAAEEETPEPSVRVVFDAKDSAIVQQIRNQNKTAAAKLYKEGYSKHFGDSMERTLKQVGLSRRAAGPVLQKEMARSLGLTAEQAAAEIVPKVFDGTAQDYFTGLSGTSINRAQNFNRMNLFGQAGLEKYRIVAIIDNRTSEICQQMDGREFTIQQGQSQMDTVLETTSVSGLRKVSGWRRNLSEFGVKSGNSFKTGPKASGFSKTLADAGMALPPYHFRCRTIVQPVGL